MPNFVKGFEKLAKESLLDKKLVIIQLSGGNDGLNTVVPYNNDIYYNRFVYHSNVRMDRNQIPYMKMIEVFEELLFTGSRHFKRGLGITIFPWELFPRKKTRLRVEKFFELIKNVLDVEKEKELQKKNYKK